MKEKLTLREALDIYYNSGYVEPVDRYVEVETGILLFRRLTKYNLIRMECGHHLVRNNGKVEATNPILCNYNYQNVKEIRPIKARSEKMFFLVPVLSTPITTIATMKTRMTTAIRTV